MTREQFTAKWRGRMLLFLTEAWAARKEKPSELGQLLDQHAQQLKEVLHGMYEDLQPKPEPPKTANGTNQPQRKP